MATLWLESCWCSTTTRVNQVDICTKHFYSIAVSTCSYSLQSILQNVNHRNQESQILCRIFMFVLRGNLHQYSISCNFSGWRHVCSSASTTSQCNFCSVCECNRPDFLCQYRYNLIRKSSHELLCYSHRNIREQLFSFKH